MVSSYEEKYVHGETMADLVTDMQCTILIIVIDDDYISPIPEDD